MQFFEDREMMTDSDPERREERALPLSVTVFTATGELKTLRLPPYKEGRFHFEGNGSIESMLKIEAKNGRWFLFCERGCCLTRGGERVGQIAPIDNGTLLGIECNGQKHILQAESVSEKSNVFVTYYIEQGQYLIGRSENCDIVYNNRLVSREHASLIWTGSEWLAENRNSTNGIYLNNRRITKAQLKIGDILYIVGLKIAIGAGFIAINNWNGQALINTPRIRRIDSERDAYFSMKPVHPTAEVSYNRKPRKRERLEIEPIEFEQPPMDPSGNNIPFLLRMGSPAIMGGRALASGNFLMAISSMVLPFITGGMTEKDRKEYEKKRVEYYTAYLRAKHEEVENARQEEMRVLNVNFPTLRDELGFVSRKERLWERRKSDEDFLQLRIGTGSVPLQTERTFPKQRFDIDPDPLETQMYELAKGDVFLDNVPIVLSLMEDFVCGITGKYSLHLVKNLIIHLCISHSYDDVKLILLAMPKDLEEMSFVRYLPHFWDDDRDNRLIATNKTEAMQLGEFLAKSLDEEAEEQKLSDRLKTHPMFVLFALDKVLLDSLGVLKPFLQADTNGGISVVTAFDGVPIETHKQIELYDDGSGTIFDLRHPEHKDQDFTVEPCDAFAAKNEMKTMASFMLKEKSAAYRLPSMVTFLEMFNAGKVEHLNPMSRWKNNNPVKSLAAPVGVGTDGELFYLDLHEKNQGPHGLVAGMTGSGKSEFIITYILSMAVNYSPDEVAFILIDYKGGGLTGAFDDPRRGIHLPHLVGTITNLDGAAVQRSLTSIQSELKRRQAIFNQAKSALDEGTMDIYSYQKHFRNGKVSEPMPHLFIISDEFAELKSQRPEFMEGLISIARIGRSLGVHLILATQKPSGVVNDQIMSNTKFRVCLKVQSKADSQDMIQRQDAAELKETGRFYLQVGFNEYFAMGQSAWCGADYQPMDQIEPEVDNSVRFVDHVGQTSLQVKPKVEKKKSEIKQIVAIVRYLSDLAKREGIQPRKLWLDPLPKEIEYQSLPGADTNSPVPEQITALIGMADDPEHQKQFPMSINLQKSKNVLIVGHSGSGKSTLLQTMLYSLTMRYSADQLQYYLIDFSGGMLASFAGAPHCGCFYNETAEKEIKEILKLIKEIIQERKKLFVDADVNNYDAYIQTNELPVILIVIDNLSGISAFKDGSTIMMNFHEMLRDAQSCGMKFVVTCGHMNEVNLRAKQELGTRLSLTLKDKYEYADVMNTRCNYTPPEVPGRGLFMDDGIPLEYHAAKRGVEVKAAELSALLKHEIQSASHAPTKFPVQRLASVDPLETFESFCEDIPAGRIPLGYSEQDARKVSIPFAQLFTMGLYFGNPNGVKPILKNLFYAMRKEQVDCIAVQRKEGSVLEEVAIGAPRVFKSDREDSERLWKYLVEEINQRKALRDRVCAEHGISPKAPNAMKIAAPYIRRNARPIVILIENTYDFCTAADEAAEKMYQAILSGGFGYHFYFIFCTYQDDPDRLSVEPLLKPFLRDGFFLFFGGAFNKQRLDSLPTEYRRETEIRKDYTTAVVKYRGGFAPLKMPCGDISEKDVDPDEMPII